MNAFKFEQQQHSQIKWGCRRRRKICLLVMKLWENLNDNDIRTDCWDTKWWCIQAFVLPVLLPFHFHPDREKITEAAVTDDWNIGNNSLRGAERPTMMRVENKMRGPHNALIITSSAIISFPPPITTRQDTIRQQQIVVVSPSSLMLLAIGYRTSSLALLMAQAAQFD